jgi:hypothetical protein
MLVSPGKWLLSLAGHCHVLAGSVEGTCSKEHDLPAAAPTADWAKESGPSCAAMLILLYAEAASLAEFGCRDTINSRLIYKARPIWADKEQRNQS